MFSLSPALIVLTALCLAGCATTQQQAGPDFKLPQGPYKLVVMRPDVAVSALTARGHLNPRADWSSTAHDHIQQLLRDFAQARGGDTRVVTTPADSGLDEAALLDLERLNVVVGATIIDFKFTAFSSLPTKRHSFDWTLGEQATGYGVKTGYDYALFVYARDSFATAGRNTLQAVTSVGCVFSLMPCLIPTENGEQLAFVSLVDLRTGDVVWFNALYSPVGDIRTPEGAQRTLRKLLGPLAQ